MKINLLSIKSLLIVAAALFASGEAKAYEWNDSIRYHGEITATLTSGDNTPFWLMNNEYGLSSRVPNNGYIRLGAFHDLDPEKKFSWGAGVDLAVAGRFTSRFVIQQLYAEVKYRCLNLFAGTKEWIAPINNPELSSGNLVFSPNARPIPQVRIGIFDYADFWGTKGWFAVKGYLAFGKFTDSHWVENWVAPKTSYATGTLYHSKAIFLRGGNAKKFPLEFELGFEMATQFGGEGHAADGKIIKMPEGWKDWVKAVFPMKGSSDTPVGDQTNVQGNMLGAWNFALSWKPGPWSVKAYYQHYFEDHSMMTFDFPWKDGLYGVEVGLPENRWVSEAVYEFLYQKYQSGPVYWDHTPAINEQVSGRDNYYNHYLYNGWEHWGMGIGNPISISPIYNDPHVMIFLSTRLWAHHLGFKGHPTPQIDYRVLATYSKSWGTYAEPFSETKSNFNLLLEVKWHPLRLKGWEGTMGIGMDAGSLIGHNYGVRLSIAKTGWLFAPKR